MTLKGDETAIVSGNIIVLDENGSGIADIFADSSDNIVVYNMQGLKMPVSKAAELKTLPTGIYIINGNKVLVK